MNQKYRNYIMWALYAALFLLVMLVQTTLFGRVRFFGVKLSLMPIVLVCVTMRTGHEAGGLFGLLTGLFWFALGTDDGTMAIVSFTVIGILAGWLCDNVFPRRFFPALFLSLGALLLHEGGLFLVKFYLGSATADLAKWVPITAGLSLAACPVIHLLSKMVGKVGGSL